MGRHFLAAAVVLTLVASTAFAQRGGRAGGPAADVDAAAAAKPTPRAADGHPDLTGVWGGGGETVKALAPGESTRILFPVRTGPDDKRIFEGTAGRRTEQAAVQIGADGEGAAPLG